MTFIAIMAARSDNRIAVHAELPTQAEADTHVAEHVDRYPGAFVVSSSVGDYRDFLVDMANKSVTVVPHPPPDFDAIDQATVDRLLLESGVTRAQIKTLFDHENRIRVLEGRSEVTVEQLKTALRKLIRGA